MKGRFLYLIFLFLLSLSFIDCAKRGRVEGGSRDTIPPVIVRSVPENYTTHFKGNEIRIYFDEYIKMKDLQKQLIISPPLDNQPMIHPFSTSKFIKVVFSDTLKHNTTYTINFGNSIVDNNEENPYPFYKYVFSTGSYIDSLKVSGTLSDALSNLPDEDIIVMLYEVNEKYNDSIIYQKKPLYISNNRLNAKEFSIENIKAGKYQLIALNDKNNNYLFDPKTDKIGFVKEFITVPTDTTYHLTLFKEKLDYKLERASSVNNQLVQFGYEGSTDSIKIEFLNDKPQNFESRITWDSGKDTLYYWYKPTIETDSLNFMVFNQKNVDTLSIRARDIAIDSIRVSALKTGTFTFDEMLKITSNLPIESYQEENIKILNKDSIEVSFGTLLDKKFNILEIDFEKEESQNYLITLFPEAITDFFGNVNDTLTLRINTRTRADYGFLSMQVIYQKPYPLIVELIKENGEAVQSISQILQKGQLNKTFSFPDIIPGNYYVRVIIDKNSNGIFDTGNFLTKSPPEEVIYFPNLIEIRANWTLSETFVLD